MYATSTLTLAVPFGICTQFSILHQFLLPKPWHLNTDIVFQYYTYPEIYGQGHLIHLNKGVILLISSFLATAITFFLPCELHHNATEQRFCYYFLKTVPKKGVFSPISRGENRTALFQEGGDAYLLKHIPPRQTAICNMIYRLCSLTTRERVRFAILTSEIRSTYRPPNVYWVNTSFFSGGFAVKAIL